MTAIESGPSSDAELLEHLQRVQLQPGDVLVATAAEGMTRDMLREVLDQLARVFPGHRIAVLPPAWELAVVGQDHPLAAAAEGS